MKALVSIRQRSFARFVAFDLAQAARRLGWAVSWIDFDAEAQRLDGAAPDAWRAALARIDAGIRAFAPDIVFTYGFEAFVPPFATTLPGAGWCVADAAAAPVACFVYDFGAPFDRPVDAASAPLVERLQGIDVRVFCWDRAALADLHRYGIAADYLPMAVNDEMFYPPPPGAPRDLPIVFSGGPTAERIDVLRRVAGHGLAIYGYDAEVWQQDPVLAASYRGFLPGRDALRETYGRARLALNVTRAHGRASLNMRVFEAMACGCLVVTDQAEAAAELFTPDETIATMGSHVEAGDVVARWLADERARARVSRRAADVVRTRHTYVQRLESIAARLRTFVAESRAWRHWQRYVAEDPAKAIRFVDALRADRELLREDCWHLADAAAQARLGNLALAQAARTRARARNPGLLVASDPLGGVAGGR
jgi:spore maturation protein CgeB